MPVSSNPFDDNPNPNNTRGTNRTPSSTNPFEDEFSTTGLTSNTTSTNPFSRDYNEPNHDYGGGISNDSGGYTEAPRNKLDRDASSSWNQLTSPEMNGEDKEGDLDDDYSQEDSGADADQEVRGEGDGGGAHVEASWQYLGDLPYRRVVLYDKVRWGTTSLTTEEDTELQDGSDTVPPSEYGLATIPSLPNSPTYLNPHEYADYLSTMTSTLIAGCPNGGPVATVTIPRTDENTMMPAEAATHRTKIRIMTCSGRLLCAIPFPPIFSPNSISTNQKQTLYSASDILTIGFTSRCILIVILRDSQCLTYNLSGEPHLPPFYVLPHEVGKGTMEIMDARVYEGGVAVLSTSMTCALVELLDDLDGDAYLAGCHIASRRIDAEVAGGTASSSRTPLAANATSTFCQNKHFAIVTPLGTAAHAAANYYSYVSMAVLPRHHSTSRHPELFLSTSDNSVVICDAASGDITDVDCRAGISAPIISMTFAPNGRFLACFSRASVLTVVSTSFETKVLDFDTSEGSPSPPADMEWCGEDSVVLRWKNLGVLMVGPYGDWLRFPYDRSGEVKIIPEVDCCRVVSDKTVQILQRVPPATAALLGVGSIVPAAMLLDASDAFLAGSPSSDELAREISKTGLLPDAIDVCADAAAREFDIVMQKRLLRAASYGMHFAYKEKDGGHVMGGALHHSNSSSGSTWNAASPAIPTTGTDGVDDDPSPRVWPSPAAVRFVTRAKKIRVMNALRDPSVGFAITLGQLESIGADGVVARLIAMKRPALATSICSYLQLDRAVRAFARAARASAFVAADRSSTDAQTAESAIRILTQDDVENEDRNETKKKKNANPKSSDANEFHRERPAWDSVKNRGGYAAVALAAHRAGRPGVANLLLLLETNPADKVPALTEIGSHADAAVVATRAMDADLIFLSLLELENSCISSNVDKTKAQANYLNSVVSQFPPEAMNLLTGYFASMKDVKFVMNLLLRAQKHSLAGTIMAGRALASSTARERQTLLQEASRVFGMGRDATFQKACTDEYLELLSEQEQLRAAYSPEIAPPSSSVTTTLFNIFSYASVKPREAHRILAEGEKIAKKFKVPEKRVWHVKVRAFAATHQWANLRSLADSRTKTPINAKYFALAAINGKQGVGEIMRYVDKVTDGEERYDLFCEAKLWKKAVEEARRLLDARRIAHVRSLCNSPEIQQICDEVLSRTG